jgi:hypothetical protein
MQANGPENILSHLDVLKKDFCEVDEVDSSFRKTMQTRFLHPGHRIKLLERSRLSDVSRRMGLRTLNLPSGCLKKRLVKLMKRCFKVTKGHANSLSASWESTKATWMLSLK